MTYKKRYEEALKSLKQTEKELRKHWVNAQKAAIEKAKKERTDLLVF